MKKIYIALSIIGLLMFGCSEKPKDTQKSTKKESTKKESAQEKVKNIYGTSDASKQKSAQTQTDGTVQANEPHIAKVLETVNAAGYTYAKVDEKDNVYWVAGPESKIEPGNTISYIEQMVMKDFKSKSLNRKFDYLMFASVLVPIGNSAKNKEAKKHQTDSGVHVESSHIEKKIASKIKVPKLKDGYTVAELYAKSAELKGKQVKIKAKVVKVSKNIMGKDWVHLQDGTGVAGKDDIIATGKNTTVKVGDIVVATGILKKDVDLGYGYFFEAILEESHFTK